MVLVKGRLAVKLPHPVILSDRGTNLGFDQHSIATPSLMAAAPLAETHS